MPWQKPVSSYITHAEQRIWFTDGSGGLSAALYHGRPSFNTRTLHVSYVVG
jgi:hypothetical protein